MRYPHTVGYTGTVEQRAFDVLDAGPLELCQACRLTPLNCESIRQAFERLRRQGLAASVRVGTARFFFLLRDATRPIDKRGACRKR